MSNRRFKYQTTLHFGTDGEPSYSEMECQFAYSVDWGSSPSRDDSGSGSQVDDCELLTVEGKPRPWDMGYGYISDDEFAETCVEKVLDREEADMIAEATDDLLADEDAARERRDEDRREAF